jgi:hypothetical protein
MLNSEVTFSLDGVGESILSSEKKSGRTLAKMLNTKVNFARNGVQEGRSLSRNMF